MGEFNPFQPSSGGWDGGVGTIVGARFVVDSRSQRYALQLTVDSEDDGEVEISYGIGGDWASYDGGDSVEHPKAADKPKGVPFNASTAYSDFFVNAYNTEAQEELSRRNLELYGNQGTRFAKLWEGLTFEWESLARNAQRPKVDTEGNRVVGSDGRPAWETVTINRTLPVKFLGVPTGMKSSGSAGSVGDGKSSPTGTSSISATDQATLETLAKGFEFTEFVDKVMEYEFQAGVGVTVGAIMALMSDDSYYNKLRSA